MSAVAARIVNMQHDGETESVLADLPMITWTFKRSDVSSASWQIPLSHMNLKRSGQFDGYYTTSGFAPKRTDFRIGVSSDNGVNWNTVHAGILGPVGVDTEQDSVEVAGVDWAAWLDQPYRFTGYTKDFKTELIQDTDVVKIWDVNTDASTIIDDLVNNLCSGTVWECVQISTSFSAGDWTTDPINTIQLGSTETVLGKIKSLSELSEPLGYEFMMDWDKTLYVFFGRQFPGTPESGIQSADSFAPSLNNIFSLKWVNKGPKATTTVGVPISFPAQKGFSTYEPSVLTYRDWWQFLPVGTTKDILDDAAGSGQYIDVYTDAYGTRDRYPQKDLSLVFDPAAMPGYPSDPTWWFQNRTGYIIHVDSEDWFIDYWRINAYFWVVEQTLSHDDAGNWKCSCVLEQIYN